MVGRAGPVDGLAVVGAQHVDRAGLDHRLQCRGRRWPGRRLSPASRSRACTVWAEVKSSERSSSSATAACWRVGLRRSPGSRCRSSWSRSCRRAGRRACRVAPVALRPACRVVVVHAVLVVVALVGGVQVPVVDVVDVVAVGDRRVTALDAVLVRVGLGDVVPPPRRPGRTHARDDGGHDEERRRRAARWCRPTVC